MLEDTGVVDNRHVELKVCAPWLLVATASQKTPTPYRPAPAAAPTETVDAVASIPAHRFCTPRTLNTGRTVTLTLISVCTMRRTTEVPRFCYKVPDL